MSQQVLDNIATGFALLGVFMVVGLVAHTLGVDGEPAMRRFYAFSLLGCGAISVVACLLGGRIHRR